MNDARLRFKAGLARARRLIWYERLKVAGMVGLRRGFRFGFGTACGFAVLSVAARHSIVPITASTWFGWIGCATAAGIACWTFANVFFRRPADDDVAERLDRATRGFNRLATAYELTGARSASRFEELAIADGLRHLDDVQHVLPVLPKRPLRIHYLDGVLAVTGLLFLSVLLLTTKKNPSVTGSASVSSLAAADAILPVPGKPISTRATEIAARSVSVMESAERSGTSASGHANRMDAESTASSTPGAAENAVAAAGAAGSSREGLGTSGRPERQGSPSGQGRPAQADPSRSPISAAPVGGVAGGPTPGAGPSGGAKSKAAPSRSGKAEPANGSKGGSASGASAGVPPPSEQGAAGDGDGAGAESEAQLPPGAGQSSSASSTPGENGEGRTPGKSVAKKSRGVAPLLLGIRQPDLFEGRPLAGPDARTKMQVPPKREPGAPAPAAAAAERSGDERPGSTYRVPTELRGVVGDYFQQFHHSAEPIVSP